jgi:ketosteroid isomerase-like protein
MTDEEQIRELMGRYEAAIERKDAAGVVACHADGAVSYELAPPLATVHTSRDSSALERWFATWEGPVRSVARDLAVRASGDVGFAFTLRHMTGTNRDGRETDLWFRSTVGLVKQAGAWHIAHLHHSVPFAMDGSGKALLDLKP